MVVLVESVVEEVKRLNGELCGGSNDDGGGVTAGCKWLLGGRLTFSLFARHFTTQECDRQTSFDSGVRHLVDVKAAARSKEPGTLRCSVVPFVPPNCDPRLVWT
jgi:hypothetical protein